MIIQILIAIGFLLVMGCIVGFITVLFCPTHHKEVVKFAKKCFLQFVESSDLPKYDKIYGKPLDWTLWSVNSKCSYDEKTGDKKQWYEIAGISIDESERRADAMDYQGYRGCCDSNHIFKIKISDEEYKKIKNETLSPEILINRFAKCIMHRGTLCF